MKKQIIVGLVSDLLPVWVIPISAPTENELSGFEVNFINRFQTSNYFYANLCRQVWLDV